MMHKSNTPLAPSTLSARVGFRWRALVSLARLGGVLLLGLWLVSGCRAVGTVGGDVGEAPATNGGESSGGSMSPFLVNGRVDHGHPSAGFLRSSAGNCTATLVGKRTVLTAAHCVGGSNTRFTVGNRTYSASRVVVHPDCVMSSASLPIVQAGQCRYVASTVEDDIALVVLDKDVNNVTPTPIASHKPRVGQRLVLVGFGKVSETGGGSGTKRMGTNTIDAVLAEKLRFVGSSGSDANLCNGDSGGPSYGSGSGGQEVVVGVHSTKEGTCGVGGRDMRVQAYKDWLVANGGGDVLVEGQAAPTPPSNPPAAGNAGEGDSCASQGCLSHLSCTQIKNSKGALLGRFCLEKCSNPGGSDAACDGSEVCTASSASSTGGVCFSSGSSQSGYADIGGGNGGGGGGTTPPTPTPAGEGQSCANRSCASGLLCAKVHTLFGEYSYCMERCQALGADPACDGGEVCVAGGGGRVCFLASGITTGFTHQGNGSSGGGGGNSGNSGWGTCSYSGAQGVCQSITQSCSGGGYISGLCPGPSDIRCCVKSSGGGGGANPPSSCGSSLETAALAALNAQRGKSGQAALSCDAKALAAARAHSQDMCTNGFAGHTGSDGSTISSRLHKAGASFSSASESVAKGFSSGSAVVGGWMGSPGNRQILLDPRWRRAAVGAISCSGGTRWTAVVLY